LKENLTVPLVVCPDCKARVSSDATACPKCGRPRQRNGVYESWQKDGIKPGGIVVSVVVISLFILGIRSCSNWFDSLPKDVDRKNQIVSGVISVPAGQETFWKLDPKPNYKNVAVKGTFTASGGQGNDVEVFISDETNVVNYKNGHKSKVVYQTDGTQTTGLIQATLAPGVVYYLVVSNSADRVNEKKVAIDVAVTFTEEVTKQ
jgi:hypothetical protein